MTPEFAGQKPLCGIIKEVNMLLAIKGSPTLGLLIKSVRELYGYSQLDLANKMKCHKQFVSNWERGASLPSNKGIKKLRRVLRLPKYAVIDSIQADFNKRIEQILK